MNNLLTACIIVALMMMSIASVPHADCESVSGYGGQAVFTAADHVHEGQKNASCDCCATCGHHHHSHAFLPYVKAGQLTALSKTYHIWDGKTYVSHLHYPPSKPPKA